MEVIVKLSLIFISLVAGGFLISYYIVVVLGELTLKDKIKFFMKALFSVVVIYLCIEFYNLS